MVPTTAAGASTMAEATAIREEAIPPRFHTDKIAEIDLQTVVRAFSNASQYRGSSSRVKPNMVRSAAVSRQTSLSKR